MIEMMNNIKKGLIKNVDENKYKFNFGHLINLMLNIDPKRRPSIKELLQMPLIQSYAMSVFLHIGMIRP